MISSMTGYAARSREIVSGEADRTSVSIEVKSVNSRFLDISFRMPDDLRGLEPLLRERISSKVQRGKLECRIAVGSVATRTANLALNDSLLDALLQASRQVQATLPGAAPMSVAEVLH